VTGGDEDEKETLRTWFKHAIAETRHFILTKPEIDERQATSSREFKDYISPITSLGFTVWDIQRTTISVVLEDSLGTQKELSGRADFVISSNVAKCHGECDVRDRDSE
jgi:hypothetical protein